MSKLDPRECELYIGTNGFITFHAQPPVETHLTESEVLTWGERIAFLFLTCVTAVKCVARDIVVTWF